jgi:hypothetical protein
MAQDARMLRRAWGWSVVVATMVLACNSGCDGGGEPGAGGRDAGGPDAGGPIGDPDEPPCTVERSLDLEESRALVPYTSGNRWFYRGRAVRSEVSSAAAYSSDTLALDPRTVDGQIVQPVRRSTIGYLDRSVESLHRIDDTGIYNHGNTDTLDTTTPLVSPYLEMPFPIEACRTFEAFATTGDYEYDLDGDGLVEAFDVSSRVWLRGFEDAETTLGVFPGSLRLERRLTRTIRTSQTMESLVDADDRTVSWFAPGVGLVKSITTTAARERLHEELIGFDVGGEGRGAVLLGTLRGDLAELGSDETDVGRPAVATDGARFLVVVRQELSFSSSKLWALLVSSRGAVEREVDLGVGGEMPVLAFDGTNYLLVYQEIGTGILGLRLSSEGAVLGAPFLISASGGGPAVAFGGGSFLVAYTVYGDSSYLDVSASRVSPQGVLLGQTVISGGPAAQSAPAVDFDGDQFFVVWQDARNDSLDGSDTDIYATRVSIEGEVIDPDGIAVATSPSPEMVPDVAFDGSHHVVAWFEDRYTSTIGDGDIRGARVGADGMLLDGPASAGGFAISTNAQTKNHPRVSRFGPGVLVVWELLDYNGLSGIFGARIDSNGQLVQTLATAEGLWLSGQPPEATFSLFRFPALASAQDRALLAWVDNVTGGGTKSLQASLLLPW